MDDVKKERNLGFGNLSLPQTYTDLRMKEEYKDCSIKKLYQG